MDEHNGTPSQVSLFRLILKKGDESYAEYQKCKEARKGYRSKDS